MARLLSASFELGGSRILLFVLGWAKERCFLEGNPGGVAENFRFCANQSSFHAGLCWTIAYLGFRAEA